MYGGYGGGMYGRSMYGGYGGGMYGGYGGYGGGMYGGGMYGGMMGPGMGSSYAESMFRMTQMLEMNSIMLEQLQEHVTVTFYRLRDVVEWIWALKNSAVKDQPEASPEDHGKSKESKEEKESEMNRIRRRFKALFILLGVFLFLIFRDNRRQKKRLLEETSWLQVTQNLARPASAAMAAASAMSGMGGMGGMNGSNQMTGSMGMSGSPGMLGYGR